MVVYAIGHSTRTFEDLIDLLKAHGVRLLCDVRTVPRSRTNRQFNADRLARRLPARGLRYVHLKTLGGLRRPLKHSRQAWRVGGFRGYADYMQTPEFARALEELLRLARRGPAAVMCAEGNPFRCHRRLLADALTARKVEVRHIVSRKTARPHSLTPFGRIVRGRVTYAPPLKKKTARLSAGRR